MSAPICTNCTSDCKSPIWVQREQRNVVHEIEGREYEWRMRPVDAGVFCNYACLFVWAGERNEAGK